SLAASVGDAWCQAHALASVGECSMRARKPAKATASFDDAISLARQSCDTQSLRVALTAAGQADFSLGRIHQGQLRLNEARSPARLLKEPAGARSALASLGAVTMWCWQMGATNDAQLATMRISGEVWSGTGDSESLRALAAMAHKQGRIDDAVQLY